VLPPKSDPLLCDETRGIVDYTDPAGNADIFDPDTRLSGFEGGLMLLVPRGGCSFESKARSAQRLGASGVLVRNTLDSRYGLLVDDGAADDVVDGATDDGTGTTPPDWSNTRWPVGGLLSSERYGDQQLRRRACPEFVADRAMFLMLLEVILFYA